MKFLSDFTYRNLHGFTRFSGDSTVLVTLIINRGRLPGLAFARSRVAVEFTSSVSNVTVEFTVRIWVVYRTFWLRLNVQLFAALLSSAGRHYRCLSCQPKLRGRLFNGGDSVTTIMEDFSQDGRHFHGGRGFMTEMEKSYRHY